MLTAVRSISETFSTCSYLSTTSYNVCFKCQCKANVAVKSSSSVETPGLDANQLKTSRLTTQVPLRPLRQALSGLFAAANASDPRLFRPSHQQPINLHLSPLESCGVKAAVV